MTAGQGPGPYGDAAGPGGTPEQPEPRGGGAPQDQPTYGQPPYGQPPYGQPQQGQPPYGQPPYGQPQQGQPPYGQPPYGQQEQSPYGHQPYPGYGAAPSAPTGYGAPTPVERPVTVRAGIGAFVGSIVISLVGQLITLLNLDTLSNLAVTDSGLSAEEAEVAAAMGDTFGVIGVVLGLIFTGVFALFVWFAWRGHNWARIVLWVAAGLGIIVGLIGAGVGSSLGVRTLPVLTFLSFVEMIFDAVAIVLLALKPSSEWYRYRGWLRATGQPG